MMRTLRQVIYTSFVGIFATTAVLMGLGLMEPSQMDAMAYLALAVTSLHNLVRE
jgi:hypothetical protein